MLRRTKILLISGLSLGLSAIVLVALPYALQYSLRSWLLQQGADQVTVSNVDFNPFTGRLALDGVRVAVAGKTRFSLDSLAVALSWRALFSKQLLFHELHADGWRITVSARQGQLYIGGLPPPVGSGAARDDKPWGLGIDRLILAHGRVDLNLPQISSRLDIRQLKLQDLAAWLPDQPVALSLAARIDGAPVDFSGRLKPFADQRWLQGQLKISALSLGPLLATVVNDLQAKLQADTTVEVSLPPRGGFNLKQSGRLGLQDFAWRSAAASLRGQQLTWQGQMQWVQPPQRKRHFSLKGDLALQQGGLSSAAKQSDVLKLAALTLEGIDMQGVQQLKVAQLTARQWAMGSASSPALQVLPLVRAEMLRAKHLSYTEQGLNIAMVDLAGLSARLQRDQQGQWNVARLLAQLQDLQGKGVEQDNKVSEPESERSSKGLRIDHIVVAQPTHLLFQDEGVKPPFSLALQTEHLEIGAVDSGRPKRPIPMQLAGRLGRHGRLTIQGSMWPFGAAPGFDVQAAVGALELYPLSSYSAPALGFRLRSGTLGAKAKFAVRQGKLDGVMKLTLRELDLTSLKNQRAAQLARLLNMPLDLALNVLRDDHNTIRLRLPVSGNPAAPDFDFSDAINQALAVGLKQGAMSYLSMMLQPYGTLISVAKFAGEQITRLRLDPVVFAPGAALLTSQTSDYLDHVARVLVARPQVAIKLCGVAVAADRAVLAGTERQSAATEAEPQLRQLALRRGEEVKRYLVEQHHIAADRLAACLPDIDAHEQAHPRVELLI